MNKLTLFLMMMAVPLLGFSADRFIDKVVRLATWAQLPLYGIAAGLISILTSVPEILVSLFAVMKGEFDLSMGNIWGSVVANTLLVVGAAAVYRPVNCQPLVARYEMPFLLGALGLWSLGVWLGFAFYVAVVAPLLWVLYMYVVHSQGIAHGEVEATRGSWRDVPALLFYFLLLWLSSEWLIDGTIELANYYELPQWLLGVSILAIGTSLPELVVSITAQMKGHDDIALGNVVGSNVFLVLVLMPLCMALAQQSHLQIIQTAILMSFFANCCLYVFVLFFDTRKTINRAEGMILLLVFFAFLLLQWQA